MSELKSRRLPDPLFAIDESHLRIGQVGNTADCLGIATAHHEPFFPEGERDDGKRASSVNGVVQMAAGDVDLPGPQPFERAGAVAVGEHNFDSRFARMAGEQGKRRIASCDQ